MVRYVSAVCVSVVNKTGRKANSAEPQACLTHVGRHSDNDSVSACQCEHIYMFPILCDHVCVCVLVSLCAIIQLTAVFLSAFT